MGDKLKEKTVALLYIFILVGVLFSRMTMFPFTVHKSLLSSLIRIIPRKSYAMTFTILPYPIPLNTFGGFCSNMVNSQCSPPQ